MSDSFDLIVIGAGPGGYVAAIKAAQLGMSVACVERQYLGGTCLNVGCIPSKALLDSSERYATAKHGLSDRGIKIDNVELDLPAMMKFKEKVVGQLTGGVGFLFKKNKITHLEGHGKIAGPGKVEVEGKTYSAKNILIATGSEPIEIPGFKFDGKHILSSTEALEIGELPEKLLIVGGGYIGVEIGSVWNRLGAHVSVLEFMDRILPASDAECAKALQKSLTKQGLEFHFGVKAKSATVKGDKVEVVYEPKDGGDATTITVDKVMVAVGRKPYTDKLGLDSVGVTPTDRGFITVDEHYKATDGVYAIGDVIGKIMLAHNAEEEGIAAVEHIHGGAGHVNYGTCPAVVYTHPELASVGLTQEEATDKFGKDGIKIGKFNLAANGRARGMGETEGFVKVIGDAKTDRLLGCHIVAAHASDMIAEAVTAMEFASSCEDLARVFHAHPTLPEAIKEAAMAASDGKAIHA
ncbi:MAG: dihydrolipoyl dehydrogenase [Planctomycetota bacterium]